MSRTIKGSKGPGYDYWSRRPYSGRGFGPGVKQLCHRAERQAGRRAPAVELAIDAAADQADDAFEDWEHDQVDRLYAHLGDDCPFEHYPVSSRSTPEYTQLLRRPV